MCGIAGIVRSEGRVNDAALRAMTRILWHRGPDDEGIWQEGSVGLGNRRLAILDLSFLGRQPMHAADGRRVITYNGEVYNYVELRRELGGEFRTGTDTEVLLHGFARWGEGALDRFNGMFALALWDRQDRTLLLARDRFGVKPLYYTVWRGDLYFASEIKALAAAGVPIEPDRAAWASYLVYGLHDHGPQTFFKDVYRLPPGHLLRWRDGEAQLRSWYDLARILAPARLDDRSEDEVAEEYTGLMADAVRLRFRSDVPVGVTLSGGLDSSTLVGVLHRLFGLDAEIHTYHYATGDPAYDETPWVRRLLEDSCYPLHIAQLRATDVPDLATESAYFQEEPYGGFPTLAMVRLFQQARAHGTVVLLGGEGMDEQWGGYDYYTRALAGTPPDALGPVQGSRSAPTRPQCLTREFAALAVPLDLPQAFPEALRNWQYRDIRFAKLPRALRFGDRASSQLSRELREPFLDYRLVELALRQPSGRLIRNGEQKVLLRRIAARLLPGEVAEAPKRPVQTPQREWLRGPLRGWVEACLESPALDASGWFDPHGLRREWARYVAGESDNSFAVWQWISVVLNDTILQRLRHEAVQAG